ncbi:ABC transporter ATPase [Urechidicola croceus]|uniref:ABC transporter ATPase n=1 Tax=Urechidicola croceus TaxID=1850246 RepID=A0A1D8PBG7_9FLAO|nr:ABC transporter ATPase [Urechidicola croceus]AOW21919.1 ABC transporter ATPase [Urechidicola croceus]
MLVPFSTLPQDSRVWVYQSNREFTNVEVTQISEKIESFMATWKRHGDDLRASYIVKYNQFIILAIDESFNSVSGCSIDSSVHFINELEKEFGVDLMNKMNTAFKVGSTINIVSLFDFQNFVKEEKISPETIVFNNMIQSKMDFETKWEVPAKESWHKRYFGTVIS